MTATNPRAIIGDNLPPPDPIDTALEPYGDTITEVENWTDGTTIENEAQLVATEVLLKQLKAARKSVGEARDVVTRPLHAAHQAEVARWKPTIEDIDRMIAAVVALQSPYKAHKAAEVAEAARQAQRVAFAAQEAARRAIDEANAGDLEAQRAADAAMVEAQVAATRANLAGKATVPGMRTVWHHEVFDPIALRKWLAANDPAAVTAFALQYAADHHRRSPMDGVRSWFTREAF